MKRDEKNSISTRKIMNYALIEFGEHGYLESSINKICSEGNISKGILYHYFNDKDELYLACVKELFERLTLFLKSELVDSKKNKTDQLECYFNARQYFFKEYPMYQRIFCDVVITPPKFLLSRINELKSDFDQFNISILSDLLQDLSLEKDISIESAVETFRLFQDFISARYQMQRDEIDLIDYEMTCKRTLRILLYGVVERKGKQDE